MTWLYVLFFCEAALLFVAFMFSKNDIMAPSVIMCFMFILSTCFAIYYNLKVGIEFSLGSCTILLSGLFVFFIAEVIFRYFFTRHSLHTYNSKGCGGATNIIDIDSIPFALILSFLAVDITVLFCFYREICNIAGVNGLAAFARYRLVSINPSSSDATFSFLLRQTLKIVIWSGYIAAFVLIQNRIYKKRGLSSYNVLLFLLAFLPQLTNIMIASRGELLRFLVFCLVAYYIVWHQKNGWHRSLAWKYFKIGFLCIILGAPAFYYITFLLGRKPGSGFVDYITVYLGCSILLFDQYIKKPVPVLGFGEETFCSLNSFLNRYFGLNLYNRKAPLEPRPETGIGGNLYTFFRRPLHDFGFIGMILFTILVAFIFAWIYYGKIKWKKNSKAVRSWTLVYGTIFYWIVISSMEQYSFFYFDIGYVLNCVLMVLGYRIMTGIKLKRNNRMICTVYDSLYAGKSTS